MRTARTQWTSCAGTPTTAAAPRASGCGRAEHGVGRHWRGGGAAGVAGCIVDRGQDIGKIAVRVGGGGAGGWQGGAYKKPSSPGDSSNEVAPGGGASPTPSRPCRVHTCRPSSSWASSTPPSAGPGPTPSPPSSSLALPSRKAATPGRERTAARPPRTVPRRTSLRLRTGAVASRAVTAAPEPRSLRRIVMWSDGRSGRVSCGGWWRSSKCDLHLSSRSGREAVGILSYRQLAQIGDAARCGLLGL